jgi:hypothetical protein
VWVVLLPFFFFFFFFFPTWSHARVRGATAVVGEWVGIPHRQIRPAAGIKLEPRDAQADRGVAVRSEGGGGGGGGGGWTAGDLKTEGIHGGWRGGRRRRRWSGGDGHLDRVRNRDLHVTPPEHVE